MRPIKQQQQLTKHLPALALAIIMTSAGLSAPAWAEHVLPAVTVTADAQSSAFSVTPARALSELQKAPGGVSLVDAQDYLTGRAGTMEDTLKLAPGVFIASRFGSDEARISIRGSGLQRTFHGRGLLLLQDGVPLNLADGGFDMQAIEPQATRYIEVERGANALRYGASTLGGAINYVSETGRTAPALSLRAEAGAFAYQRYNVSAAAAKGDLDAYASANFQTQDGFRDHARQRNSRVVGNVGVQVAPNIESRFYATAVDTDSQLPGNLSYADVKSDPRKAEAGSLNRDAKRDFQLYRLANRTAVNHSDGGITEITAYAAKKILFHPLSFARIEQNNRDLGLGLRHTQPTQWLGGQQEQVIGVNWRRGLTIDDRCSYGGASAGTHPCSTLSKSNKLTANNLEAYAESRWTLTAKTIVTVGGQWTDAQRKVTAGDVPSAPFYDQHYRRFSPKLGVLHQLSPVLAVYANASASVEPPSFSEGPVSGGAPLQAQRARAYEVGARAAVNLAVAKVEWDLSVYRVNIKNELLTLTPVGLLPATRNADRTVHQGVEAGLGITQQRWRVVASYLYNDFSFQRDASLGNNAIAGVPEQVFTAEAAYRLAEHLWFGPTLRAASRAWVDHSNSLAAPGYSVWGLKLNQSAGHGIDWFVEGRNLSDKRYAATTGVILNAGGVDQAQFSPGDGRSVYAGVSKAF